MHTHRKAPSRTQVGSRSHTHTNLRFASAANPLRTRRRSYRGSRTIADAPSSSASSSFQAPLLGAPELRGRRRGAHYPPAAVVSQGHPLPTTALPHIPAAAAATHHHTAVVTHGHARTHSRAVAGCRRTHLFPAAHKSHTILLDGAAWRARAIARCFASALPSESVSLGRFRAPAAEKERRGRRHAVIGGPAHTREHSAASAASFEGCFTGTDHHHAHTRF